MKTRLTDRPMVLAIGVLLAIGFTPQSAQAQSFAGVVNALSYPTASQRFFQEGMERLEQEILYLRQQRFQPQQPVLEIDHLSFAEQYHRRSEPTEGEVQYRILESVPSRSLN
jgi:hypothetical protein